MILLMEISDDPSGSCAFAASASSFVANVFVDCSFAALSFSEVCSFHVFPFRFLDRELHIKLAITNYGKLNLTPAGGLCQ